MALLKVCAAAGCDDLAVEGLSHCDDHEARRLDHLKARRAKAQTGEDAQAHRKLYALAAWRDGRRSYLGRHPLCADCAELGVFEPATDVDHITPHKGDRRLFFDRSNWQSLCHACHSRKTAREVFHTGGVS